MRTPTISTPARSRSTSSASKRSIDYTVQDHAEGADALLHSQLCVTTSPASRQQGDRSTSSATTGPGRRTWSATAPTRLPNGCRNRSLTMVKNPNFHDAANVKIDKVVYYPTEDIRRGVQALQGRRAGLHLRRPVRTIKDADHQEMPKAEFHNAPYFGTYFYGINMTREPLSTTRALRKALMLAINREVIVRQDHPGAASCRPMPGCRRACRAMSSRRSKAQNMNQAEREAGQEVL